MDNKLRIYLIGSFFDFRDKIIESLPQYEFSDPRTHRQSCMAKLVSDDMGQAESCPVSLFVLPKGKRPGTMSYAEIGAAAANNNHILVADENEQQDALLKKLARNHFSNLDDAIAFLNTNPKFEINNKPRIIMKKYPAVLGPIEIKMNNIYFCGTKDQQLMETIAKAQEKRPDRKYIISSDDVFKDFQSIGSYDLIVVNFPGEVEWDRKACFMMGGAYAHDIPVLLREEKDWRYPPFQALVRRHTRTLEGVLEYVTEVNDQHINKEAVNMYNFFKKETERRQAH